MSDSVEAGAPKRRFIVIALVVAVVFAGLVVVAQLTSKKDAPPPTAAPSAAAPSSGVPLGPRPEELSMVRRDPKDPMAMGDVNAPVVLVLWTDLRCPFCAVFNREVLPVIEKEYIKPGKVRLEVTDIAFFGEQSEKAAAAAAAAANQGKFFEFLRAVYAEAPEKGHPDLPREKLVHFATVAGVPDMARFQRDLDDESLVTEVQAATVRAQQLTVASVPFFVAGRSALAGAQPIGTFREYLDDAIKHAAG
ncbi:thioredoxin domain-containing protein [Gordonia sp. X0973]|uniref:DsbA family protein n=1 Tax=Gordonia sp. X0973 TaxID=2742602 RepID=UPI000F53373B|nr:thioredoxin domain-containing protein [Gordonia sp. X0973]QKT06584.1 thioredoxin domain-containing protein [Gordonia sp. X0973]